MLKIATWNINSVRLRIDSVKRFLAEENIDILCLQETKVEDDKFPIQPLAEFGYGYTVYSGEKSYNGVAIISKIPLRGVKAEKFVNGDKRHISAILPGGTELHNFYVPAGGDEPDPEKNPKFDHKLKFVDKMTLWFKKSRAQKDKIIIVGDFNIAPLENDVWSHKQLLGVVSHTPPETQRLSKLKKSLNWIDTSREFIPDDEKLYSWWSYRNRDWRKSDRGRRLDHIWITPTLEPALLSSKILKDIRDWQSPSDHVPITAEFKD